MKLSSTPKVQGRGRKANPAPEVVLREAAEFLASPEAQEIDDPCVTLQASDLKWSKSKDKGYATLTARAKTLREDKDNPVNVRVSRIDGNIHIVPGEDS